MGTGAILFGTGCATAAYSLACAAGLDEEVFPCNAKIFQADIVSISEYLCRDLVR